mgnify:FL=1
MTHGFSLVEVLIAILIIACVAVAFTGMVTQGRRTTEFNSRYVEAAFLCRKVLETMCREALWKFDTLESDGEPLPLVSNDATERSRFFERLDLSSAGVTKLHPHLEEHLEHFLVQATVEPYEDYEDVKKVSVSVHYRLSGADDSWHKVDLSTLVVRRTAI